MPVYININEPTATFQYLHTKFLRNTVAILYKSKSQFVDALPALIEESEHSSLKLALQQTFDDLQKQSNILKNLIKLIGEQQPTPHCLAVNHMFKEVTDLLNDSDGNSLTNDMAMLIYVNGVLSMQLSILKLLYDLSRRSILKPYAQLLKEIINITEDNLSLYSIVAPDMIFIHHMAAIRANLLSN